LGDALQKLLGRSAGMLRQVAREADRLPDLSQPPPAPPPKRTSTSRPYIFPPRPLSPRRAWQLATHQQVPDLPAQGWWGSAIAEYLHIDPHTAYKYMELEQLPEPRPLPRPSGAEPYRAYLQQRWTEGCTNIRQLWHEIQAQGYSGRYISVWRITRSWV